MLLITALLILKAFDQMRAEPPVCTKKDFCTPVPVGTCDKRLCQTFSLEDYASFGENGVRVFTWNFGQSPYLRYCPIRFSLEKKESYDGMVSVNLPFTLNSGPYCNISTFNTSKIFSFKPDPYTGMPTELSFNEAGDIYDGCMIYFKPGKAYIRRTCRVDPPPPYGEECASIYVVEDANGNCDRDDLNSFLRTLGVDFQQNVVDCLQKYE